MTRIFTAARLLAAICLLLLPIPVHGGGSAVIIIYQPICTFSDAEDPLAPKGFRILPVPFLSMFDHGRVPYNGIAFPYEMLTDAPREQKQGDSNVVSQSGVRIAGDGTKVFVHFTELKLSAGLAQVATEDDIAEATLECIRRVAHENKQSPKLAILGKKEDEAKWAKWKEAFEKQDLAKPFIRPKK